MITYDACDPANQNALIAQLSEKEFKESIAQTDDNGVEKMISFSKCIPGFEYVSRS